MGRAFVCRPETLKGRLSTSATDGTGAYKHFGFAHFQFYQTKLFYLAKVLGYFTVKIPSPPHHSISSAKCNWPCCRYRNTHLFEGEKGGHHMLFGTLKLKSQIRKACFDSPWPKGPTSLNDLCKNIYCSVFKSMLAYFQLV